ncbi:MAG: hypothetical protein EA422_05695 [Gemmatimonadales bacterium]|nr:MAG: hypothetical protein EA422_05695 [Gemmatimonadales bacterium]
MRLRGRGTLGGTTALAASLLWASGAFPPAQVAHPVGGGCGVVIFDLYPHGDHMHVADYHPVVGDGDGDGDGDGCGDPVFLDDETLLFVVFPSSSAEDAQERGSEAGLPRVVVHRLSGSLPDAGTGRREDEATPGLNPRPTPDGTAFSFIRPAHLGWSGRLHRRAPGQEASVPLIPEVDDVMGHEWMDDSTLVLMREGSPGVLWVADLEVGELRQVGRGVLHGLERIPGEAAVTFVELDGDRSWVRRMDSAAESPSTLVDTPPGSREHAWMPPGVLGPGAALVMGHEGVLYRFEPGADRFWHPIVNLNAYTGSFTGVSVSPSGLRVAVVEGG